MAHGTPPSLRASWLVRGVTGIDPSPPAVGAAVGAADAGDVSLTTLSAVDLTVVPRRLTSRFAATRRTPFNMSTDRPLPSTALPWAAVTDEPNAIVSSVCATLPCVMVSM